MEFQVDAALGHGDAFRFKEFALQAGVGFAEEEFAAGAQYAMPRYAFTGRCCRHGMTGSAGAATEAQNSSNIPIC
jgi:hypothetical protein